MVPMNRDVTTEETNDTAPTLSPEEKMEALLTEYTPRIVAALKTLGLQIDDDITAEELSQILNDESTFLSKLPAGTTLEDIQNSPDVAEFEEVIVEFMSKVQEILFESLLG